VSQCPQKVADKHTESGVPVTFTQQLVEQSVFWVHVLWHARAPVESNVEHAKPLQHWRVPPHVSS